MKELISKYEKLREKSSDKNYKLNRCSRTISKHDKVKYRKTEICNGSGLWGASTEYKWVEVGRRTITNDPMSLDLELDRHIWNCDMTPTKVERENYRQETVCYDKWEGPGCHESLGEYQEDFIRTGDLLESYFNRHLKTPKGIGFHEWIETELKEINKPCKCECKCDKCE